MRTLDAPIEKSTRSQTRRKRGRLRRSRCVKVYESLDKRGLEEGKWNNKRNGEICLKKWIGKTHMIIIFPHGAEFLTRALLGPPWKEFTLACSAITSVSSCTNIILKTWQET